METAMPSKFIRIVSSRPPKEAMVEISPDDTASVVLEKAGLDPNGSWLMKPGDRAEYEPTELPFNDVSDEGKLHVIPNSMVGSH